MKLASKIAASFLNGLEATNAKMVNAVFNHGRVYAIEPTTGDNVTCPMCGGSEGFLVRGGYQNNYSAWSCRDRSCIAINAKQQVIVPKSEKPVVTLEQMGCPLSMQKAHLSQVSMSHEEETAISNLVTNRFANSLFYGPPGCGKTYLAWAIIQHWVEQKKQTARFIHWDKLHNSWLDEFNNKGVRNLSVALSEAPFLVIDDMCSREASDKFLSWMQVILGVRFDNMRPTVFTSNQDPNTIREIVMEPVWSRMACACVQVSGSDRRRGTH